LRSSSLVPDSASIAAITFANDGPAVACNVCTWDVVNFGSMTPSSNCTSSIAAHTTSGLRPPSLIDSCFTRDCIAAVRPRMRTLPPKTSSTSSSRQSAGARSIASSAVM
jgi:hypothetical protein